MKWALGLAVLLVTACGGGGGGDGTPVSGPLGTGSISGLVVTPGGAGIAGAQMSLSGAALATTTTSANGAYTFSSLPSGTYSVGPLVPGMTFSPLSASVVVGSQLVSGVTFTQTVVTVQPTQPIADFMSALHSTMVGSFTASERTLGNQLAAQGTFYSGAHYTLSRQSYLSLVQKFADDSLAHVRSKAQTGVIDRVAVSALFDGYRAMDAAYADSYYRGVTWGLSGSSLNTFVSETVQSSNGIYSAAISQLP